MKSKNNINNLLYYELKTYKNFSNQTKKDYSKKDKYNPYHKNSYKKEFENISTIEDDENSFSDEYKDLKYHPAPKIFKEHDKTYNFKVKWKTEMCKYIEMNGQCKYGDSCAYAHSKEELNPKRQTYNYKTKPCRQFFELGYCSYGIRCQFSHQKGKPLKLNEDGEHVSYMKFINELLSDGQISLDLLNRPRLKVFDDIVKVTSEESQSSRLKFYNDIKEQKSDIKRTTSKISIDSSNTNVSSEYNERY